MDRIVSKLRDVLQKQFKILMTDFKVITHPEGDQKELYKVKTKLDGAFFIKEVQSDLGLDLEVTYKFLENYSVKKFLLSKPLKTKFDTFTFLIDKKYFQLLPWIDLEAIHPNLFDPSILFTAYDEFFQKVHGTELHSDFWQTYEIWLRRPIEVLTNKFGPRLPYLAEYNEALNLFFKRVALKKSVSHCDIHSKNVFINENKIVFLDWDLCRTSFVIRDYIDIASIFIQKKNGKYILPSQTQRELEIRLHSFGTGVSGEDIFLLSSRNLLGLLQNSKDIESELVQIQIFSESFKTVL